MHKPSLKSLDDRDLHRLVRQLEGVAVGLESVSTMLGEFSEFDAEDLEAFAEHARELERRAKDFSARIEAIRLGR